MAAVIVPSKISNGSNSFCETQYVPVLGGESGMKLLHFREAHSPKSSLEYFVKEGQVPRIQFGSANILPGERLPSQLRSRHDKQSEISYIISGSCTFHADDEVEVLNQGDVLYNPRGTSHFVENPTDKRCVVFWVLVEE